jgi:hypothetical protein
MSCRCQPPVVISSSLAGIRRLADWLSLFPPHGRPIRSVVLVSLRVRAVKRHENGFISDPVVFGPKARFGFCDIPIAGE